MPLFEGFSAVGDRSKIEWTDASWNPIRGCSRVSEGCRNCYAERQAARQAGRRGAYEGLVQLGTRRNSIESAKRGPRRGPSWTGVVRLADEDTLRLPLRWRQPRRIFVNSMSDLFHEKLERRMIAAIFGIMALCGRHVFQVLTKRPERFPGFMEHLDERICVANAFRLLGEPCPTCDMSHEWPLPNVWLGVSVENQRTADERIPLLLQTPAAVHFVSYEPALGPVDFRRPQFGKKTAIDWIIAGGESGPGARPAHPDWFRSARDQCQAAGVPFFFKQWGEWLPLDHAQIPFPSGVHYAWAENPPGKAQACKRVGKKLAGRLLDGRFWNEYPGLVERA